jgi:L-arabinose isomerase
MLEVCPSIAAGRPRVEIHPLGIGNREDPVRLVFDATPGPAVVIGMADMGDRFRLVSNAVEVIPPDEPLPRLPVARAIWKPAPSLATSAECWLTAGGPHHTVLTQAVGAETLRDFATMAETELLLIDERTTVDDFIDRVRWNQAYYRMFR